VLIFISDLHLEDGTLGGQRYIPASAFEGVFEDLATHADNADAEEVTLVFLGDIFDLIRTTRWFDGEFGIPHEERPWGEHPSEAAALRILDGVIRHAENEQALAVLRGERVTTPFPAKVKQVRRIYIPGNHDRLCNRYPSLQRRVCETLNVTHVAPGTPADLAAIRPDAPFFAHELRDEDHQVFARHGQEWDPFNFEASESFRFQEHTPIPWDDYMQTPIGDVLACEVASRLPTLVQDRLEARHSHWERVRDNLRDLFDVRPLIALIPWLSYRVTGYDDAVRKAINTAVAQAAREFEALPFVRRWMEKHDRLWPPFDRADRLQLVFGLLESFKLTDFEKVLPHVERATQWWYGDNYASKAAEEFERLNKDTTAAQPVSYVLYGHTHRPDQVAIDVSDRCSCVYLNTGTWRPAHRQTLAKTGFIAWKNLTYTIIYRPGEKPSRGEVTQAPAFETWTGGLKGA
jgi:UDP-2,3-diacylglucosamine pyrophosphatase LpxH